MLNEQKNKNDYEAYYINQKPKLLKEFDKGFKHCKKAIDQHQKTWTRTEFTEKAETNLLN